MGPVGLRARALAVVRAATQGSAPEYDVKRFVEKGEPPADLTGDPIEDSPWRATQAESRAGQRFSIMGRDECDDGETGDRGDDEQGIVGHGGLLSAQIS